MRKAEFAVPTEVIAEFVEEMTDKEMENAITGTNEDGEILIEILYEKSESKLIDELEEILDTLREGMEEDNEEEENGK